jgi:hypothetical protein
MHTAHSYASKSPPLIFAGFLFRFFIIIFGKSYPLHFFPAPPSPDEVHKSEARVVAMSSWLHSHELAM